MRVGVIAGELGGQSTGVGTYLQGVLEAAAQLEFDWTWHLLFRGECPESSLPDDPRFVAHPGSGRLGTVLWEQLEVPARLARLEIDVVFSPGYSLPSWMPCPGVVTLHDLSFECLPEEFGWRERWRRRLLARRASRMARRIVVDTRAIADQVQAEYGIDASRIRVVPLAVDARRWEDAATVASRDLIAGLGIEQPYLLFVGSLLERRCVRLMLELMAALRVNRPDLKLVLAGRNRLRREQVLDRWIDELGVADAVVRLGYAPQESLAALYRFADAVLYLSRYEGFGIPPLEALACGTPAIVGPGLGLDELWRDYPYRVPELRLEAVRPVVERVLSDESERSRILSEAYQVLDRTTWQRVAEETAAVLQEAVSP